MISLTADQKNNANIIMSLIVFSCAIMIILASGLGSLLSPYTTAGKRGEPDEALLYISGIIIVLTLIAAIIINFFIKIKEEPKPHA